MDAQNNPAENVPDAGIGRDNTRWRLILLVLCAVGAGLVIGILALQVMEFLFYKAPPNVWPQPGAGGAVNAPLALSAPLSPVIPTMPSVPPAPVTTTTAPSEAVTSSGVTSMPAVATTSAPAPATAVP